MDMIKIEKYLPDSAKNATHKSAASMEQVVRALAEGNEGKLVSFEVPKPGVALFFVMGDAARQAVVREFKKLANVVVTDVPALAIGQEKNMAQQQKADKARERFKKRTG